MSNFFQSILTNASAIQASYMGPDYPYYKYIKSPSELGMSDKGDALGNDINGLKNYVEVLVTGKGNGTTTGQPLGNKYFLKTGGKCKAIDSCNNKGADCQLQDADRYIYIDNVPAGNIPFISSGTGTNFSDFKGLIPGSISNLNNFRPMELYQAFLSGPKPDCRELKMETIDIYNNKSTESHYVTLIDIGNMDPCIFPDKKNPENGNQCKETFSNLKNMDNKCYTCYKIPKDPVSQFYFASVSVLGVYIFYCVLKKNKMI